MEGNYRRCTILLFHFFKFAFQNVVNLVKLCQCFDINSFSLISQENIETNYNLIKLVT